MSRFLDNDSQSWPFTTGGSESILSCPSKDGLLSHQNNCLKCHRIVCWKNEFRSECTIPKEQKNSCKEIWTNSTLTFCIWGLLKLSRSILCSKAWKAYTNAFEQSSQVYRKSWSHILLTCNLPPSEICSLLVDFELLHFWRFTPRSKILGCT